MAKCLSEGRMHQLWRQSILILCKHRCQICGKYGDEYLDCHHIVRKVKKITRWLPENGSSLCRDCHRKLHTQNKVKREFETGWKYIDLLDELNLLTYPDYLQKEGLTHSEYYDRLASRMKLIIKE